jgi:hypothetical protein
MAYLYFTVTAVLLYLFSDWLLNKIEQRIGKRLEYRSVVFFAIIAVLAYSSFSFIDTLMTPPDGTIHHETQNTDQVAPPTVMP